MDVRNIPRKKYLDRIIPWIGKDLVKVLTGMRRVGKSKILLQMYEYINQHGVSLEEMIFIDKESMQWDHIRSYTELYEITKDKKVIFIDEVQTIFEWERTILSLQSEGKDIYITGSNSAILASGLATNLRGRSLQIHIYPLDYTEFLEFSQKNHSPEVFEKYIQYGGLPYITHLPDNAQLINEYTKNIISTILLRDIIERFTIRNGGLFQLLLQYIAKEIGTLFASQSITKFLKSQKIQVSPTTILDYLGYLIDAYMIEKCPRYDIRGKKLFEIRQKYYFTDIGMRNALVGGYTKTDISGILENVVVTNLLANGWDIMIGEIGDYEIDCIAEKDGKKMYIQIAYLLESESTKKREFRPLLQIEDNWEKYVISLDTGASGSVEGVIWMHVADFLLSKVR